MLAVTRHFSRVKLKKKTRSKEEQVHQILLTTRSIADGGGDSGAAIQGHSSHHYHATLQQEGEGEGEETKEKKEQQQEQGQQQEQEQKKETEYAVKEAQDNA